jgi:hypothetical protein
LANFARQHLRSKFSKALPEDLSPPFIDDLARSELSEKKCKKITALTKNGRFDKIISPYFQIPKIIIKGSDGK